MPTTPSVAFITRRPILLAGLLTAAITAIAGVWRPAVLSRLDYNAYDLLTRWTGHGEPTGRVVIVDVDEHSLGAIGQWPWRRDLLGQLVTRLRDAGASAVAFDMVFAERDERAAIPPGTHADAAFADAIRGSPAVLGYAFTFESAPPQSGSCVRTSLGVAVLRAAGDDAASGLFRAAGAVCDVAVLAEAANASGFLNATPDADGVLRRVPLLIEFQDRVYPSLALAAVALAVDSQQVVLSLGRVGSASMQLGDRAVPLDGKGNLLLRFRGRKHVFSSVSAADVVLGRFAPERINGRIAIVGATAFGTRETVTTPLDTLVSGVEVQATVADTLLGRNFVSRPEFAAFGESAVALASGIVMAFAIARCGASWGGLVALVCLAGPWAGALGAFSALRAFFSPVLPTVGGLAELAAITVASVAWEQRRANTASSKLMTTQRLMVQSLLSLTEIRDTSTGFHARRTQQYARLLAVRLSAHERYRTFLTPERIDLLSSLAPLHDIGKIGVPDRLLNKPGTLTLDEIAEMRMHPVYGRDAIIQAQRQAGAYDDDVLEMAKDIVFTHHERWDGLGYPRGLKGDQIPIPGRVVMLVDVYDALTTRRVYREPLTHEAAVSMIVGASGTHFEPAVVEAFLAVAPEFRRISLEARARDKRSAAS